MFPSILGASVDKLSDRMVETTHRSGFTDQPAKACFPGHSLAEWVRVEIHLVKLSLFVYVAGVMVKCDIQA
jgi:hypothetical protein